jgi:hypothetical protein
MVQNVGDRPQYVLKIHRWVDTLNTCKDTKIGALDSTNVQS